MTARITTGDLITSISGGVFDYRGDVITADDLIAAVSGGVFEIADEALIYLDMSPAALISTLIQTLELCSKPSDNLGWPIFIAFLPDAPQVPQNACAVYDTTGVADGRIMTGETIIHPGIQLSVRSTDYQTGYQKIYQLACALDLVFRVTLSREAITYLIQNVTRSSPIVSLGREQSTDRFLFTSNHVVTLKKV
jgi:hypothetical protein